MFVYGADFFVYRPGIFLTCVGLVLTLPLTFGPIAIGPVTLSLYWMLVGVTLTLVGFQSFLSGCLAQMIYDESGRVRDRWLRIFRYNRTVAASAVIFLVGLVLTSFLLSNYIRFGLRLRGFGAYEYMAITGLMLMMASFTLFVFTLLLHALALRLRSPRDDPPVTHASKT
jgi:uncharacterized membrane protein